MKKSTAQLQREIDKALAVRAVPRRRMAKDRSKNTVRHNLQKLANLLADATGDGDWITVDLDRLNDWCGVDLDPLILNTANIDAALSRAVTELLDQGVEPKHVGQRAVPGVAE